MIAICENDGSIGIVLIAKIQKDCPVRLIKVIKGSFDTKTWDLYNPSLYRSFTKEDENLLTDDEKVQLL